MKITSLLPITIMLVAASPFISSYAQDKPPVVQAATLRELSGGEVRKIDKDSKKITIKHGELKNLDMPPMTMVFQVKEMALLDKVKAGDKVKFFAEKMDGAFVVTDIQVGK